MKNLFTDLSNYEIIKELEYTLEVEIEITIEPKLVVGIETLLDIISIALQNGKKSNQKGLNKQMASVTSLLV